MNEFNITESALSKIIKTGYSLLDLKPFLHLVRKNQELGQLKKYFNAHECSGIIHTDIQKGFIRAETVSYEDYIKMWKRAGFQNKWCMEARGQRLYCQ